MRQLPQEQDREERPARRVGAARRRDGAAERGQRARHGADDGVPDRDALQRRVDRDVEHDRQHGEACRERVGGRVEDGRAERRADEPVQDRGRSGDAARGDRARGRPRHPRIVVPLDGVVQRGPAARREARPEHQPGEHDPVYRPVGGEDVARGGHHHDEDRDARFEQLLEVREHHPERVGARVVGGVSRHGSRSRGAHRGRRGRCENERATAGMFRQ